MIKELTVDEINRRRKGFAYFPFCAGVIILGIAAVPITSFYLRTWKPILYWLPALFLISILPLEFDGTLVASILIINAGYSYITVKKINKSLLRKDITPESQASASSDVEQESNDLERTVLDILEEHYSISVGRICAYSDCPHEMVKAKLEYLKNAGVVEEKFTVSDTIEYSLL